MFCFFEKKAKFDAFLKIFIKYLIVGAKAIALINSLFFKKKKLVCHEMELFYPANIIFFYIAL